MARSFASLTTAVLVSRPFVYLVAAVLVAHGLVHLLGTVVYFELVELAELGYKTTLLGGAVDVGDAGIRIFGLLCAVATVGFVAAAGAMLAGWNRWRELLIGVALFSLALTTLDWTVASAGAVLNLVILTGAVVAPRL